MPGLIFVGSIALILGLYGLLGKLYTRSGGTTDRGSVYQIAWPLFMRWANHLLLVGATLLVVAGIIALVT
jgi:hypothetical protein